MMGRRFRIRLGVATIVAFVAAPALSGSGTVSAAGPSLNGGGSSFAKLEIDQWRAEVARKPYELSINYVAQGSSFGRQQYSSGSLDFAASDIPFTGAELEAVRNGPRADFVYVPVSAGGLGFMYNLIDEAGQPVTTLNLTPRTVCRIFTDDTLTWDDPEIQQVNDVDLPAERVRAIVRADGSGTSYVLSEYCIATSPDVWEEFKQKEANNNNDVADLLAGRPTSSWPTNRFGSAVAADGVAAAVADSSGLYSITYNEAGFAKVRGFPNASVQNKFGNFTQPTEQAVSIALGYAAGRPDGTFQLDFDGPDERAYFPSTYSYVIAQTTGFDPAKGEVLARFLCYSITRGQRVELTETLGYARLSAPLVELGKAAIAQIPGAPPWDQCKVESAPPPPPPPTAGGGGDAGGGGSAGGGGTDAGGGASAGGGSANGGDATGDGGGTDAGGGTPSGASGGGGASSGGGSAAGVPGGGAAVGTPTAGSPSGVTGIDVATVADGVGATTCTDPETGLEAACDSVQQTSLADGTGGVIQAANSPNQKAATPKNPPIDDRSGRPPATQIMWWLVQGASVCAIGLALSGVRTRMT